MHSRKDIPSSFIRWISACLQPDELRRPPSFESPAVASHPLRVLGFPVICIDAYRRKCSKSRNENKSYYATSSGVIVNSDRSNLCCQCAHGHLETQRRQIEVRARRNQKHNGHLRPSQG